MGVWPSQCEDKAWNQLPNLTPSNPKIWTPGISNSPTPSLNLEGFPRFKNSHFWPVFFAQMKRSYLRCNKTGVSDGWAEHWGDRRSPRAADWTSLLDLTMHLPNTKGFVIEAQNVKKNRWLYGIFSHLAFVQLAPREMGKCHLDGFALDSVNKAIAYWAATELGNTIWRLLLFLVQKWKPAHEQ